MPKGLKRETNTKHFNPLSAIGTIRLQKLIHIEN